MWAIESFANWIISNPLRNKSSLKLLNERETKSAHAVSLSAAGLDFGSVRQDKSSKVIALRVKNVGYKPLRFLVPRLPSDFVYLGSEIGEVLPNAEVTLLLQFSPKTGGTKTGDLVIPVLPIGNVTVPVEGICKPYTFLHNGLHRHAGTQNYDGDV